MMENAFLLENFHGVDVFLSLYEPQKKNIVFVGPDRVLNSFLSATIPHDQIRGVVPLILSFTIFPILGLIENGYLEWRQ